MNTHTHTHIPTHIHTYPHAHTYSYIHTHINILIYNHTSTPSTPPSAYTPPYKCVHRTKHALSGFGPGALRAPGLVTAQIRSLYPSASPGQDSSPTLMRLGSILEIELLPRPQASWEGALRPQARAEQSVVLAQGVAPLPRPGGGCFQGRESSGGSGNLRLGGRRPAIVSG